MENARDTDVAEEENEERWREMRREREREFAVKLNLIKLPVRLTKCVLKYGNGVSEEISLTT